MSNGGSYDPHAVEQEIYQNWEAGGHFHAEPDPKQPPYVIDIPLPNVTGALHLGHALNNTLQDILIRHKRMTGHDAMWMPGTDHAGIATQAVVERRLKEEQNLTRHELGRDGLVAKIWEWKELYGGRILNQLRMIGCSCDWPRTRFTLDEVCARAVYEVFFQWFKAGLIYRGLRLVNWDAQLQTAVADDEIFHETVKGHLWHYRYPLEGRDATAEDARVGVDYLSIATTRPETMLGDTAIAVHPDDDRYRHLIGKRCVLPLMNRPIPIIADGLLVKPEFGTGCVKVTPAHDPNDYACGQRHKLEMINILTQDGKINDNGGAYAGLDRYDARKKVVADLEELGLLEEIEDYETEIGHSDRSKSPIEPMLSEQWFVHMADLAESAMEAVRDGRVQFYPERYAKTFLDWLGEKRDWCISRQLWWGHRIPVWSSACTDEADATKKLAALRGELQAACAESHWHVCQTADEDGTPRLLACLRDPTDESTESILDKHGLVRDPDVLDTWFSSALWPFSTLGWPNNYNNGPDQTVTPRANPKQFTDLDYFYPTSVLVTAREIITLWVARMVMTGLYFQQRVPFQHVHIHPNIQDGQGRRMSKSAGNGVDPVDIIKRYGADALRFTMAQMDTETQDARLPVAYLCPHCGHLTQHASVVPHGKFPADIHQVKCSGCKQPFATVWAPEDKKQELGVGIDTSDRFEMGRNFCNKIWQVSTGLVFANLHNYNPKPLKPAELPLEDRWILSRLAAAVADCNRRLSRYQLSELASTLYTFFWSDFCDWYVELIKLRLFARDEAGNVAPRDDESAAVARQVLVYVLDQSLRLLHPVLPFVTEAIWSQLNERAPQRGLTELRDPEPMLINARWPEPADDLRDAEVERELTALQDVIRALRDTLARVNTNRSAVKQPAIGKLPHAVIRADEHIVAALHDQHAVVERLGRCEKLEIGTDVSKPDESATQVLTGVEVYVPLSGLMDLAAERKRLEKERDELPRAPQACAGQARQRGFRRQGAGRRR